MNNKLCKAFFWTVCFTVSTVFWGCGPEPMGACGSTQEGNACGIDKDIADVDLSSSSVREVSSSGMENSSSSSEKISSSSAKSSSSFEMSSSSSGGNPPPSPKPKVFMSSAVEKVFDLDTKGREHYGIQGIPAAKLMEPNPLDIPVFLDSTHQIQVIWNGEVPDYRVDTKYDNGTNTSGYWNYYTDSDDGGMSKINWPIEPEQSGEYRFNAVIDSCKGFCGSVTLAGKRLEGEDVADGDKKAGYVGMIFNVAGINPEYLNGHAPENSRSFVDVTEWDGLCVEYMSAISLAVRLDPGDSLTSLIESASGNDDIPYISLGNSDSLVTRCVEWENFYQWEGEYEMSGDQAAEHLAAIELKLAGKYNEPEFKIKALYWMKIRSVKDFLNE